VTIGDNVVIGARSVVTRDIPSGTVAVGAPARAIKTIADYKTNSFLSGKMTKLMSPQEKREFYLDLYNLNR
jgi:serine acetyltransferase